MFSYPPQLFTCYRVPYRETIVKSVISTEFLIKNGTQTNHKISPKSV